MKRNSKWYFQNEKKIAKRYNLKLTKRSGAGWLEKEDAYNEYILAQFKTTEKESYRLQLDDLEILFKNSTMGNKIPLFVVEFYKKFDLLIMKPEHLLLISKYLQYNNCLHDIKSDIEYKDVRMSNKSIKSNNIVEENKLLDEIDMMFDNRIKREKNKKSKKDFIERVKGDETY